MCKAVVLILHYITALRSQKCAFIHSNMLYICTCIQAYVNKYIPLLAYLAFRLHSVY